MKKLAQFISIIFHPILLPTWMFLIFILSGICEFSFIKVDVCLAVIFGTTFILPALSLLVLKKIKVIETFTMALALYNFYLICNLILCIIVFWINFWWKISMHGTGWGAFTSMLLIMTTISAKLFLPYLLIGIILSGLVGSARLYLKSHSNSQIYAGFAVGFIIPLLIYNFIV